MSEDTKEKTTFNYPFGKFQYTRMPFGLKNAPAVFQSVMEQVLKPVASVAQNYIDDVVVFSGS